MDVGNATDVVGLVFSKAFDQVPQDIPTGPLGGMWATQSYCWMDLLVILERRHRWSSAKFCCASCVSWHLCKGGDVTGTSIKFTDGSYNFRRQNQESGWP